MKVALAQINPIIGALEYNREKIIHMIELSRKNGAELVVFPEMALLGYPPEDLVLIPSFIAALEKELGIIQKATKGIAVIIGTVRKNPLKGEKGLNNTAAIIEDSKLLGFQDKSLLPTYDVFNERRYFEPAEKNTPFKIRGKNVAVTICEDIWEHAKEVGYSTYLHDPVHELKKRNIDLMINLSSSPYYKGRPRVRIEVAKKAAQTLGKPLLLCNQVGAHDSLIFDGHSLAFDANGSLCALAKGFEEDLLIVDTAAKSAEVAFTTTAGEELFNALRLGLADYFQKLGFEKALLGLSGGIDSAVVAAIAAAALGEKNVTALSMPSRFTLKQSMEDAATIASTLHIELNTIPIEPVFESYLQTLEPFFEDKPWDVTEENIQARIRGNYLMAYSNKFGYLVLSCANKSEMSMGYSTLYGDMCGALTPLGDLSKGDIYALCNWINREKNIIPKSVLERAPSAELKAEQKDSDTLPPYPIVDAVLQDYVEGHEDPEKIASKHGIDLELVKNIVRKIHLNEYKRRQAPPVLRVTRKAFNVGRRFPIVQRWNV